MKKLLLILACAFSLNTWAVTPATIPSLTIRGHSDGSTRTITNSEGNIKVLICYILGVGLDCSPRDTASSATSGYTPPGGKQFRVVGIGADSIAAGAHNITGGYNDTDCGLNTSCAFVSDNWIAGAAPSGSVSIIALPATAGATGGSLVYNFVVPAGKFMMFTTTGSPVLIITVYGIEETL